MGPRTFGFSIAGAVFVVDRLTKWLIQQRVGLGDVHTIIPGFFDIIHTENPGAAFSMFADAHPAWRTFLLVGLNMAAAALIATLLWQPARIGNNRVLRTGLALILGGALGNVYDRIVSGAVTDFLDFYAAGYHWPAFNAADSAISIGAALVLLDLMRSRHAAVKA